MRTNELWITINLINWLSILSCLWGESVGIKNAVTVPKER